MGEREKCLGLPLGMWAGCGSVLCGWVWELVHKTKTPKVFRRRFTDSSKSLFQFIKFISLLQFIEFIVFIHQINLYNTSNFVIHQIIFVNSSNLSHQFIKFIASIRQIQIQPQWPYSPKSSSNSSCVSIPLILSVNFSLLSLKK
jgi:hypothetical protein